jgi:molybdopterin synthase catalytic subunit
MGRDVNVNADADGEQITVHVRLFALLRERAGRDALELRLRSGATVEEAMRALGERNGLGALLERLPVRVAVNRDYAEPQTTLAAGDELAVIPPVSGGARDDRASSEVAGVTLHVRVGTQAPSIERLSRIVGDRGTGAIVVFQGVTREVPLLHYEAYAEMAEQRITQIMRECVARHALRGAAVEHRIGSVPRGEPSVVVAVAAAHRAEAFAAAREAIDRIKADAPIWKREHSDDGERRWV